MPSEPISLLPSATDPAGALIAGVLYDPLYRLDPSLQPVPELAAGLPSMTGDGLSWSVTLARPDLRFQDGTPLTASDVAFSLRLARSPACPLGRDLCDSVARSLDRVEAPAPDRVAIVLLAADQSFLAEALGRLPIVSEAGVRAARDAIIATAGDLDPGAPDAQVGRIAEATNAEACLTDSPPFGCRLADHIPDLEATLAAVGVALPSRTIWTDATGALDAEAYAGALLDRVAAVGQVLSGREMEALAAALALIDPVSRPVGSGPYRLERLEPGSGATLVANPDHVGGVPGIERLELRVIHDPAAAVTLLQTGELDWLPQVEPDVGAALSVSEHIRAGVRPLAMQRAIVFNTRPGRLYEDERTRQAFSACLDREAIVSAASAGAQLPATSWGAPGSWALPAGPPAPADVERAATLLDAAGWRLGDDGIRVRDGVRLSSEIAVRPSRADLQAFAQAASVALRACGIELTIVDLDLTGDLQLRQLQWPNPFDTLLVARSMGVDPDQDMDAYATEHATTEDNPADANPGGFSSEPVDALIAEGRVALTQAARADVYGRLDALLDTQVPAWPLWFETAMAGISDRVVVAGAPVDPTLPRYAWDIASWSLR